MKHTSKNNFIINNFVDKRFLLLEIKKSLKRIPYKYIVIVINELIELLLLELKNKFTFTIENFATFTYKKYNNYIFLNFKTGNKQSSKEITKINLLIDKKIKNLLKYKYEELR